MTPDETPERVTTAALFRETAALRNEVVGILESMRQEINARFDSLDRRFPSIDAHDELVRRVIRLEQSTVPLATHNIECMRVKELEADIDKLKERVWIASGAAAVIGTIASPLIAWVIQRI